MEETIIKESSDDTLEEYLKRRFQRANSLFLKKQYVEAIDTYNKAFEIAYKKKNNLAYNNDAIESFKTFIAEKYTPGYKNNNDMDV